MKKGRKNPETENIIDKITGIKTSQEDEKKATREKTIAFLYQHPVSFLPTDKIEGDVPISQKVLPNMIAIHKNKNVIHHSHITGKIIGYPHDFCNERTGENYCTIPTFARNRFRFYFFLFLKGIRPSV